MDSELQISWERCPAGPAEGTGCPRTLPVPEPVGVGWQGPQGSTALQVIGSLNPPSHAGIPLVAGPQDPKAALSEGRSAGEGPSWLLSPSPLPIAHVERWVDAALALLRRQIISGHRHRRTRRGVRGCEPCRGCRGGHGRDGSCGPGPFPRCPPGTLCPRAAAGLPGTAARLPAGTAVLPLPAAGRGRGASSAAPLIRGQRFRGSRRAPRRGPRAPRPRCPLPPGPLPLLLYPSRGISGGGGSGALTQGSHRR